MCRPCEPQPAPVRSGHPAGGFTLLELLVVIGVISVLMGIGLGFLGRTDPEAVAAAVLAGETRAAKLTARAEGVPTEVWVRPGAPGEPGTVQARLLEPACAFHFEPGQPVLDERLRPELGGEEVAAGRFGHARRPREGDRAALLSWRVDPIVADLGDGFVLRLDLLLERRDACLLVDMGQVLEVRLDEASAVEARLRVTDPDGATMRARVTGALPLPVGRWTTLEVGWDARALWLAVDGREVARAGAPGRVEQEDGLVLRLSPPDDPVPGVVDEVRLSTFGWSPAQALPIELQPRRPFRFSWDARGEPVEQPVVEYEDLGGSS